MATIWPWIALSIGPVNIPTMKKYNIHTTLSSKHWEILKKYTEKHETQQKVLELALESLENGSKKDVALSPEEKYWLGLAGLQSACIIQKNGLKLLINVADIAAFQEYVARDKPMEFALEHYYQKTLKEFSLKEVVEGVVVISRMSHWFDMVDYMDKGDHYMLKMTQFLGLNLSKIQEILFKSVFTTYGARTESTISEKTFFMKIYKN